MTNDLLRKGRDTDQRTPYEDEAEVGADVYKPRKVYD